jgi:hypothetical protein
MSATHMSATRHCRRRGCKRSHEARRTDNFKVCH